MRYFLILFVVFLFACSQENDSDNFDYNSHYNINENIDKIFDEGDTVAYHELAGRYVTDNRSGDFLPFAMIMANKHNYPHAYYDVYQASKNLQAYSFNGYSYEDCDPKTKELALDYLIAGGIKGYDRSIEELQEILLDSSKKSDIINSDILNYKYGSFLDSLIKTID